MYRSFPAHDLDTSGQMICMIYMISPLVQLGRSHTTCMIYENILPGLDLYYTDDDPAHHIITVGQGLVRGTILNTTYGTH